MVAKITTVGGAERVDAVPFDPDRSAKSAMEWDVHDALPAIRELTGTLAGAPPESWLARRDLLSSGEDDPHFVVEVERDGMAKLRFGDDAHGRRPNAGTSFAARYRVGNGLSGNVGAGTIVHVVSPEPAVLRARNPLPARNGVDMEDDAVVRRRAPEAFRHQERAVTRADYEEVTQRHAGVQRAAAALRWTGSWHTVFLTVDRERGLALDKNFKGELGRHVDRYRMAGHDLQFDDPIKVSLEIELEVCVRPGYLHSHVRAGLLEVLSNRVLPDGRLGQFHPDRLSFGRTVYLSPIYAAARQVAGVASVRATCFQRQGQDDHGPLADGYLSLSRLQIPRLDNDPNFPEHGELRLTLHGGQG
jgi:predicted phage baseplate assembly protein